MAEMGGKAHRALSYAVHNGVLRADNHSGAHAQHPVPSLSGTHWQPLALGAQLHERAPRYLFPPSRGGLRCLFWELFEPPLSLQGDNVAV